MERSLVERITFNYAVKNPDVISSIDSSLFEDSDVKVMYEEVKKYYDKYDSTINFNVLVDLGSMRGISKSAVQSIDNVGYADYPDHYVINTIKRFIKTHKFNSALAGVISDYSKTKDSVDDNIYDIVNKGIDNFNAINDEEFDDSYGSDFNDAKNHFVEVEDVIPTTFRFFNSFLNGGYYKGTLNIYLGFLNVGKSTFLCNDAAFYMKRNMDVLFITLEMTETEIMQKVGANLFDINVNNYNNDKVKVGSYLNQNRNSPNPLGELKVKSFPMGTVTADDIKSFYRKAYSKKNKKPQIVIIDYIGEMVTRNKMAQFNKSDFYKTICSELKAFAQKEKLVLISAFQLNRSGSNVSDYDVTSIAESIGVGRVADNLMGIIRTNENYRDRVYWLKLIKMRRGKGANYRCELNIDPFKERITQDNNEAILTTL